ncbi:hypothetical protein RHO12_10425 [Orbus sturtevantii]|uniref:phage baseplate protein n=1 Tax=Orbus sturtevantii TaxID=3074109 RepID=UPI00370D8A04
MELMSLLSLQQNNSVSLISNSFGSFYFDAVTTEQHSSKLKIVENPIESGANVADHSLLEPKEISLSGLMVGYTPAYNPLSNRLNYCPMVDYALPFEVKTMSAQAEQSVNRIMSGYEATRSQANNILADFLPDYSDVMFDNSLGDRIANAYEQLLSLQKSGEVLTVQTSAKQYSNMLLASVQMNQSTKMTGEFSLAFREVFIAYTQMTSGLTIIKPEDKTNLGKTQPEKCEKSTLKWSWNWFW